jgi:hypothetical protein
MPGNITSGLAYSVRAQQRAGSGLVEGEEGQEVVVVAEAPGLLGCRQRRRVEGGKAVGERVAPADHDIGLVALGDVVGLVDAVSELAECKPCRGGLGGPGGRGQRCRAEQRGRRRDGQRPLEHVAAAVAARDHRADGVVGRRRKRDVVEGLEGFRLVGEAILLHGTGPSFQR